MILMLLLLAGAEARPNVLWLTCEDMSPSLGCYGDPDAVTPNLDAFAKAAVRYTHAFSVAGVCAPSRSCLITGMYPTTLGSQYMRCRARLPLGVTAFTVPLRAAGYYCTNNVKQDYNLDETPGAWDESSNKAHWRNRGAGQRFFAVFNSVVTHESQIRAAEGAYRKNTARLTDAQRHDPAKVRVPPFHPDCPESRKDWARYHDNVTAMDHWFGDRLAELEKAGLADDTVVFFYSDHGVGLPRGKRWLYDTGMRVPLMVRFGKNVARLAPSGPGTVTDRLVSFVDFGPTAISLAGVPVPKQMQGEPFLGKAAAGPREAVYGHRDRMDERNDTTRAVRERRFKYIRNYQWFRPWAQPLAYMELMPTTRAWRGLHADGKLTADAAKWMAATKPFEELYDTDADPHELKNLAGDPRHAADLDRLRGRHLEWYRSTRDLGLMPEAEVEARAKGRTRFEMGRDPKAYDGERYREAAEAVARRASAAELRALLKDPDAAVRWWGATGVGALGRAEAEDGLRAALKDSSGAVRVAAALSLHQLGKGGGVEPLVTALKDVNPWVRHAAALALDELGEKARPAKAALGAAKGDPNEYVVRAVTHALAVLGR
ncbi:MAG: sulfatase-like hydrolase/transferase [Gemmataceae bacterium]